MKKFLFGFLCVLIGLDAMSGERERCQRLVGKGTNDNEVVYFDHSSYHYQCESKRFCANDEEVAILNSSCIRGWGDQPCKENYIYKCVITGDDHWRAIKPIPICDYEMINGITGGDYANNKKRLLVLQNQYTTGVLLRYSKDSSGGYSVYDAGKSYVVKKAHYGFVNSQSTTGTVNEVLSGYSEHSVCIAYLCEDMFEANADRTQCVDALYIYDVEPESSLDSDDGASGDGNGNDNGSSGAVVQNTGDGSGGAVGQNKAGDACSSSDLGAVNFATAGVYVNSGGTLKCAATACKSGTYLVVNARGQSQGWCVAANYCSSVKKQKNHTLNIIDGTKTDLQCNAPSGDGNNKSGGAVANTKQNYTVSGTVVDGEKEPLVGATINVGTAWHLTTDADGNFTGQYTGVGTDVAKVSFVGCDELEFQISELKQKSIVLNCNTQIEEVVVAGTYQPRNCTAEELAAINASAGVTMMYEESVVCNPSACKDGFRLNESNPEYKTCDEVEVLEEEINEEIDEEVNEELEEEQEEPEEFSQEDELAGNGLTPVTPRLSQQESEQKVGELRDNYDAMKKNEQSLANRTLGAAAMGSMGIGGMMVASSLSEQKSDADAERDMAAYLATFKCDYGAGRNFKGGETNIELPGASELIPLYSEYVSLANDLKLRKEQLGLKAGIEAEKILDSATTGLYDDVGIGITSGAYASLARALQNPDGADAKMWAEQKEKTAKNLKTGAITAGVGAVVGIAGNAIINHNVKNKANEIVTRYESMKQLKRDVDNIPPVTSQCPRGTSGVWPFCKCAGNAEFISELNKCENCTGGQVAVVENDMQQCKCPNDKPLWDSRTDKCVAESTTCTPQCTPTEGSNLVVQQDCTCTCINGFRMGTDGACTCDGKIENGICVIVQVQDSSLTLIATTETSSVSLNSDNLFKIGSSELRSEAQAALQEFASNLKNQDGVTDCEIEITGYTDPVGGEKLNQNLSEQRANAVSDYLKSLSEFKAVILAGQPTVRGMGENSCFCGAGTMPVPDDKKSSADYKVCVGKDANTRVTGNDRYAPCRRVVIEAKCKKTTSSSALLDGIQDGGAGK